MTAKVSSSKRRQPDGAIYRKDAVREMLTPDEFKLYGELQVEDQVDIAHLLLSLLQVDKAKALLHAFSKMGRRVGGPSNR